MQERVNAGENRQDASLNPVPESTNSSALLPWRFYLVMDVKTHGNLPHRGCKGKETTITRKLHIKDVSRVCNRFIIWLDFVKYFNRLFLFIALEEFFLANVQRWLFMSCFIFKHAIHARSFSLSWGIVKVQLGRGVRGHLFQKVLSSFFFVFFAVLH